MRFFFLLCLSLLLMNNPSQSFARGSEDGNKYGKELKAFELMAHSMIEKEGKEKTCRKFEEMRSYAPHITKDTSQYLPIAMRFLARNLILCGPEGTFAFIENLDIPFAARTQLIRAYIPPLVSHNYYKETVDLMAFSKKLYLKEKGNSGKGVVPYDVLLEKAALGLAEYGDVERAKMLASKTNDVAGLAPKIDAKYKKWLQKRGKK